jgi:hypothetical protein
MALVSLAVAVALTAPAAASRASSRSISEIWPNADGANLALTSEIWPNQLSVDTSIGATAGSNA